MTAEEEKEVLGRLSTTTRLEDFKDCDFVIEAATEQIPLKKEIFQTLDAVTRKEAILASNTSSISITRIASFTQQAGSGGGHAFLQPPAPVMKLIETRPGDGDLRGDLSDRQRTQPEVGQRPPWRRKTFPASSPAA